MDVYDAIRARRDVREFRPDPVPSEVLRRLLEAAHCAPSVGFMQPWDFVLVRSLETRRRIHASFLEENARAAARYGAERRQLYGRLKLEGVLEAPLNLCVTCHRERGGEVLGRSTVRDTDLYSTCLAVQNLWLAARAEGIGVGWVSILDPGIVAELLALPSAVMPVAYLCIGYPLAFADTPMLETVGWRQRLPLADLVHDERYDRPADSLFPPPAPPSGDPPPRETPEPQLERKRSAQRAAGERRGVARGRPCAGPPKT
jgi:5,6-dimethylbenzimidazole synthase